VSFCFSLAHVSRRLRLVFLLFQVKTPGKFCVSFKERERIDIFFRFDSADLASNCSISDLSEGDRVEWTIKREGKKLDDKKFHDLVVVAQLKDILECSTMLLVSRQLVRVRQE
jgi:hypothetical protein